MKDVRVPAIARSMVDFVARFPWLSLLLGCALCGALVPGISKIRAQFNYKGFFYREDPMRVDFARFERQFGNDDAVVVAIHSPSDVFDTETGELIREFTEEMWLVPEVIRVDSLANYNWVHAEDDDLVVEPLLPEDEPLTPELLKDRKSVALKHEVVPRYLVSEDAKTALVFATIKPGIDAPPNVSAIIPAVQALTQKYQRGDHKFYISGGPAVTYGFKRAAQVDAKLLYPLSFVLTLVFLAILLRSLVGVILALFVIIPSILATLGLMGHLDIEFTNITFIVPQILIAIGVADAVHILTTFFRRLATSIDRRKAARHALTKNFTPTLITSVTTTLGFLSFTTSSLKPVVGLGILGSFGTMTAWFATYLLLGALLFILPIKRKIRPIHISAKSERRARKLASRLVQHKKLIVLGTSLLCLGAFAISAFNTINSDPFKYFKEGYPVRVANEFIEDAVGGARGCELSISSGIEDGIKDPEFLSKVEFLQHWLEEMPD
ncbi:MAG: MMPL family transporter, partial [Myxococcota bacterium]